ncbi:uncharacterized protein LOC132273659 [Cornus florida]|uniref:uncharacterized protein LOC132273659 n=1 Tax=Cornus florida TaxID=4283 RepID=UPI00289BF7D0|nr:uncharacterized protein LOC132273659 [Cornus florida]XP_059630632.1 uncharacterized protein LOC132273659 [Cornus florida]
MELVYVGSSEFVNDERLARRLKRKGLATGNSEPNTSSSRLKRTREENRLGRETDDDFRPNTSSSRLKRTGEENRLGCETDDDFGSHMNDRELADLVGEGGGDDLPDEEDDMDPKYKMFLENLSEDGNSYRLEVTVLNGRSLLIRYEKECELDNELELQTARKSGDCLNIKKIEVRKDVSDVLSKDKIETQKNSRNVLGKDMMESPKSLENGRVDKCYREFLNCIELEGDCIVFVTDNGKRVNYEEDVDSSSDVEIIEMDNAPSKNPFVTSRMFDSSMEGDKRVGLPRESKRSQFREKVMDILRKPFDQEEYEELLHNIKELKPVERNIDLRSGPLSYHASNSFKSYLDHFVDLKSKINEARFDRRKELTLLRGFFYWLQNVTREGAFRPWLDSSCLEVMPGNR